MRVTLAASSSFALFGQTIASAQRVFEAHTQAALPSYITDYAPLVYFHSQEVAWPSKLDTHLTHGPRVSYQH